ncbi:MAG: NFACT family protein [Phascolarctobacterium sp.]|nr:NFACT family protein [Phascolarctobacterium sp.]
MNLEGLTIRLICDNLKENITGRTISRIVMPWKSSLVLYLRGAALCADLASSLYIPDALPENPEVPSAFCMLLRKHLEEGRIDSIEQSGLDRVIAFEIDLLSGGGRIVTKKLIFELTGKNSNIILTEGGKIIDSLKHVGRGKSSYRSVLPGLEYVPPPVKEGLDILTADPEAIAAAVAESAKKDLEHALISAACGIGRYTAGILLKEAGLSAKDTGLKDAGKLAGTIKKLQDKVKSSKSVYALISRRNQVVTIVPLPTKDTDYEVMEFNGINAALNFAAHLTPAALQQQEVLTKTVAAETVRLKKKLPALHGDLNRAENAEDERIIADTLMAGLNLIKKGQASVKLQSIYDEKMLDIPLSPVLTPSENAQRYYKRYNKFKRAINEIKNQIAETERQIAYLESIEASLLTAQARNEIDEIRAEMLAAGLIKETRKKRPAPAKPAPLHIKPSADTDIYIGKNNRQNDYVTFTLGSPKDLWLHVKDIPGSHVILKTTLSAPRREDILTAARLATWFSRARGGSNVPVDMTERRNVKKPSGAKPGFVIFTGQTTLFVTPDEASLKKYLE